jgi:4-diphosphocytidyl-2-C-methyl-D-erythritol kinase
VLFVVILFMHSIELFSHAKINLRLDILGKRPDGYHDIRTVFQKITLGDELSIATAKSGIDVECDHPQVPLNEANLVCTAAGTLIGRNKIKDGLRIGIKKRIPVAAGLGGGSSNAAATLMGINQLFELGLTDEELMEIGRTIGADVPFFIFGNSALATGIGNLLEPLTVKPRLLLLLITPDIPISTAWAYGNIRRRLTNSLNNTTIPQCINHLAEVITILSNDLEKVVLPHYPVIQTIKDELLDKGAKGSLMSGSGSTVFGIFESEGEAQEALAQIKIPKNWQVNISKNV